MIVAILFTSIHIECSTRDDQREPFVFRCGAAPLMLDEDSHTTQKKALRNIMSGCPSVLVLLAMFSAASITVILPLNMGAWLKNSSEYVNSHPLQPRQMNWC